MYAIVDIETTGGYAAAGAITEIAILVHDGEKVIRHFETLINPHRHIPPYITALTGISNSMVASAPSFDEVAEEVYSILKDCIFVAHNVNFDYSFVHHQLKSAGFLLPPRKLCTVRLSKKVFPGLPSYSLGNLCRSLSIEIENRHRAGGDAKATVLLFEHCLTQGGMEHITAMLKKSSSEQWLPLHLKKQDITSLPIGPGVYYFSDRKEKVIYVGKAVNIRKRVSSHFTQNDPDRKRQNFVRQIHSIQYKECATELEALVLESNEIKRLWPKHNTSQKQPAQQYALYLFEDNRGYRRLAIDKKKKNIPHLYNFNLLHEGQVMLKKAMEEFGLNAKLCFLDMQPFTATEWEVLESSSVYNKKVDDLCKALDKRLPSFVLLDEGLNENEQLCLLVERGCFWGMGYVPKQLAFSRSEELKLYLQPYRDNDFIRNSIFTFAEKYPEKRISIDL